MPRRAVLALGAICALAAALRFATLDGQSLWFDESVTAQLMRLDFWGLIKEIPSSESTPPLYYALAWPWTHVFGTSEPGLRSLSALFGLATVPVVWALGKRLAGDVGGLLAALLTAVNPMLVWFSQEARSYALLALLTTLGTLLWLQALDAPARGRLLAWGVVSALALATHYFALYVVAPQAIWLVFRLNGSSTRLAALALPVASAAALLPLGLEQRGNDNATFIGDRPLLTRIEQIPKQYLTGYDAPAEVLLSVIAAVAIAAALAGAVLLMRRGAPTSADARWVAVIIACAVLLPLVGSLAGEDQLLARNTIAALPLVLALAGAGLAAVRVVPRALAALAACTSGLVTVVGVASDAQLQRDDWRGAAHALGPITAPRVVSAPAAAIIPLRYYLPRTQELTSGQALVAELDYLAIAEVKEQGRVAPARHATAPAVPAGFTLKQRVFGKTFTVLRLTAAKPISVPPTGVSTDLNGNPATVLLVARR